MPLEVGLGIIVERRAALTTRIRSIEGATLPHHDGAQLVAYPDGGMRLLLPAIIGQRRQIGASRDDTTFR